MQTEKQKRGRLGYEAIEIVLMVHKRVYFDSSQYSIPVTWKFSGKVVLRVGKSIAFINYVMHLPKFYPTIPCTGRRQAL